jgi:hypothetical protein
MLRYGSLAAFRFFHRFARGGDVIAGSAWCDNLPHTVQAPME